MDRYANIKRTMLEAKGLGQLLKTEVTKAPTDEELNQLREQVQKKHQLEKRANEASSLDVFSNIVYLVKSKFNLEESNARMIAGDIVTKAAPLQEKLGLSLMDAVSKVIEAMEDRYKNTGDLDMPIYNSMLQQGNKQKEADAYDVQQRLFDNLDVNYTKAGTYASLVKQLAKDFSIKYRDYTERQIANAIVNVAVNGKDIAIIKDIKRSSLLQKSLEMEMLQHEPK